ncbi:hypothetical protein I4F81_007082 [Pyropia yezoensis]|uniref:Uncharacterized protein n=1 Tax=Pyropia yezoensis TaxID=2788 RepID=A0ACC3C3I6_PYRYE|nr:hypothetical protein I4F81_007082 [Neopyropia yezoensis]
MGGVWGGFLGHYVLLCGYDAAADEFEMRDPASRRDVCWIKGDVLEAARRAFGTDEDIIAVAPADGLSLPSAPRPPPPLAARGAGGAPQQLQQDGGPRPAVPPGATVFASTVATTGRP